MNEHCDKVQAKGGVRDSPKRSAKYSIMRILIIALVTYLVVCFAVFLIQSKLIFIPSRKIDSTPDDINRAYEPVLLKTADRVSIAGWFIPHERARGTAIFFHGNAGNISHRLVTIHALHELGLNTLIVDYRGYGESEGAPSEKGLYADAEAAWQYVVDEKGESPDRIVLVGRSLGGAVAIELASRHTPGVLIVESTFTSLVDVAKEHFPFLPTSLLLRHRFPSINRIGKIDCPKLILHGRDDTLIPIEIGRTLFEAASEPKAFIETPGEHNNSGFTHTDAFTRKVNEFLDRHLVPVAAGE